MMIPSFGYPEVMCLVLSDTDTMKNKYYGKSKTYVSSYILWRVVFNQGATDTRILK